jgi:hypothetical protein
MYVENAASGRRRFKALTGQRTPKNRRHVRPA